MTTESEEKHSDQNSDNEPVDPLGQANGEVPEEPTEAPAHGAFIGIVTPPFKSDEWQVIFFGGHHGTFR